MGTSISAVHNEAAKRGQEDEKQAKDALDIMMTTADDKLKLFMSQVLNSRGDGYVKVDTVVSSSKSVEAGVSEDSSELEKSVRDLVEDVAQGKFVDAICECAHLAIHSLFGSYSGHQSEYQVYKIIVGPLGGVYRVDFYLFAYMFTSDTLLKLTKNVVATSVIQSSVKLKNVDPNTVRVIVQQSYGELGEAKCKELFDVIIKSINDDLIAHPEKKGAMWVDAPTKHRKHVEAISDKSPDQPLTPDTPHDAEMNTPLAKADWEKLLKLFPEVLKGKTYEIMEKEWRDSHLSLTWKNVASKGELLRRSPSSLGSDGENIDELTWCVFAVFIDLVYVGLGCWNLRDTLRREDARELITEINIMYHHDKTQFEVLMEGFKNAHNAKEMAVALFKFGKFFASAYGFEAVAKAMFFHLSPWEMFLYSVISLSEFVAAFGTPGLVFIAEIVYVLDCSTFLTTDIANLITAWNKTQLSQ